MCFNIRELLTDEISLRERRGEREREKKKTIKN